MSTSVRHTLLPFDDKAHFWHGYALCPLGRCWLLGTDCGAVCALEWVGPAAQGADRNSGCAPGAPDRPPSAAIPLPQARYALTLRHLRHDPAAAARTAQRLWHTFPAPPADAWRLMPYGTPFAVRVWRALLDTAPASGMRTTYRTLAVAIGQPAASRAVGSALGSNPLLWVIPCHRVQRADGGTGGFRWGMDLKRQLLAAEAAIAQSHRGSDSNSTSKQAAC
jgi:O-6-methylguanine DNA methyltransferase